MLGLALLAIPGSAPRRLAAQEALSVTDIPLESRGCCLDEVEDGAEIDDLDIEGNDALAASTVKNAIYTTSSGWLPWGKEQTLNKTEFLDDLQRIHILYQRHGYFDARLDSYRVQPKGDKVTVTFTIAEGEPTVVDSLGIDGLEPIDGEELASQLRDRIPLQHGETFNEADLLASQSVIEAEFKNQGYAFATVLLEYRIHKAERSASVTYTIDPGDIYYIGDVRVRGYEDNDDDPIIRKQLAFDRGEAYSLQDIQTSQRRIYELALFRRVDIEPQLASLRGDTVDVVVTVAPAPTHAVRVGVGYGTEDLIRLRASWLDRNFLGGTRQLEVRGEYSRLDREAAVTYRQPFFLIPDLNYLATAFLRYEIEPNYTVERLGGSTRFGYRISPDLDSNFGLTAERADFSNFDEGVLIPELGRDFLASSHLLYASAGSSFDNTDSLFSPTRGFTARLDYQIGLPFGAFDYAYHRVTFLLTHYREVREGWVLAGKVLPGVIYTYRGDPNQDGEGRVPLFQRLFAGGSTSVRGYERRQLGPKDDPKAFGQERDPEPIGGNSLFETSVELRFPLRGRIRGAAFIDAGNVWTSASEISLGDLQYTPGAGIRYATPVGPIRLDVAKRLSNDESFLPGWVFHISIGNAF